MTTFAQNPELEQFPHGDVVQQQIAEKLAEFSAYVDTSRWTNLHLNSGGYLQATIPIDQINSHDFPINHAHSSDLASQMSKEAEKNGGTGQRLPLDLTTVIGREGLEVFDGFHRHDGLLQNGAVAVHATLRCGMTEEELIDLRIAATRKFGLELPRTVEMAQNAWENTPWKDKIDVYQAFSMVANKSSGRGYGLSKEEKVAIEAWVNEKSRIWNITPEEVNRYLKETNEFDLEFVALMRELGPDGERGFTPKTARKVIRQFSMLFEGDTIVDTEMVTLVAETVNSLVLNHEDALAVSRVIYDATDYEEAVLLVEKLDAQAIASIVSIERAKRKKGPKIQDSFPVHKRDTVQPPAQLKDGSSNGDTDVKTPAETSARTIEELIALTPNHDLLDILGRAIQAVRTRYNRGDIPETPYTRTEMHRFAGLLNVMAGAGQDEWGVHRGEYKNNGEIHEAIESICKYLKFGGDKPKLPSSQDTQASHILGKVIQFTREHINESITEERERLNEFKLTWSRRFNQAR